MKIELSELLLFHVIQQLNDLKELLMASNQQAQDKLNEVLTSQQKVAGEIANLQSASNQQTELIRQLQEQVANEGVSQATMDLINQVAQGQQALDDAIPDVPTPPSA